MVTMTGFCLLIHHLSKNWNRNIYPSSPWVNTIPDFSMHIYLIWKLSLKIKQISTASKTGAFCLRNNFPSGIYNTVLLYLLIQLLNLVLLSWNCSAAKWLWSQSHIGHSHFWTNFSRNSEPQQPPGPIYLCWVPSSWCRLQHKTNCIFGFLCSISLPPLLSCSSKQIFLLLS